MIKKYIILSFFFIIFLSTYILAKEKFDILRCAIHIHSDFSAERSKPLEDIILEARKKKLDVIIPTDHDIMRWEYGIFPFRNIFKKSYILKSVLSLGPERYLNTINDLSKKYPDILIVPGVESAPYYFWTGSPLKKNLQINNWHKHILVIGLKKPEDYKNLPLVSNPGCQKFNFLLLWPLLLIPLAVLYRKILLLSYLMVFSGILLFANNFPFTTFEFNQYSKNQGEKPYQHLINYANKKGAITFWAHPEAPNWQEASKIGEVKIATPQYPESILNTFGHNGFAIYTEGFRKSGNIGGYWDQALMEYCSGTRDKPFWAIGEIDYGLNSFSIDQLVNHLFVKQKNEASVIEALGNGNFYITTKGKEWEPFIKSYSFSSGKNKAICGQEIEYDKPVKIKLSIRMKNNKQRNFKMEIIRNGNLLKTLTSKTPADLVFKDHKPLSEGKNYYRIVITGRDYEHVAFNPVFIIKK